MKRPLSRMAGVKPATEVEEKDKPVVAEAAPVKPGGNGGAEPADGKRPADAKAKPNGKPVSDEEAPPPKVLGESKFDVVSSALMSFVIGTGFGVGWLFVMYLTMLAYAKADRIPQRVEVIEVFGGGGGTLDGTPGAVEEMNVAGADAADMASNNMEDASNFEPPQVEVTSSAVIDALSDIPPDIAIDMADALPNADLVAMGKKASRVGTGKAYGTGNGPGGGIPREQRWTIVFERVNRPTSTLASLTSWEWSLRHPRARGVWSMPRTSRRRRTGELAWLGPTSGCSSCGRERAGSRRTWPCFRRRASTWATSRFFSSILPRWKTSSRRWK